MEGTIGEIRMFAGNFSPRTWSFCNGQIISIASNSALFSILGTTYGGNGTTTFALPDFRGRVAVGTGTGPGLSNIVLGQAGGTETNVLSTANLPAHTHPMTASTDAASTNSPAGNSLAVNPRGGITPYAPGAANQVPMGSVTGSAGSGIAVNNMQPYLGMNYVICLMGIYPSRN
ncbi:MAG: phage tail protein [Bacteroidetes bacterium]|nr:MAG: phage tail protein [Bacteroidota bacterium]